MCCKAYSLENGNFLKAHYPLFAMAKLEFKDLSFEEQKDKVRISFLRTFYAEILKKDLEAIGKFKISTNSIEFPDVPQSKAKRFNFLLAKSFESLKNKITKKPTIYIHQNSGIPLIGNSYIGLIDRNTSIIELRVITGCNLNCTYCSVNQDIRPVDFVVEKDYILQEFKNLVEHKEIKDIEAHIGTQGEPLLYSPLPELIKGLSEMPEVSVIALDTNGTLLTKDKVDELVDAGLTRFCFSINALDQKLAEKIAGCPYKIEHILDVLDHISKQDVELILTPVWVPGINDDEIPKLIKLSQKLNCKIGIQNFLNYQFGKNPAKQMSWEEFIKKMKKLEKEFNAHLLFDFKKDFNIRETKTLEKPFRKGNTVKAKIVCPGRLKGEMLAVADNRNITIPKCDAEIGNTVKLKITREKHNIFYGVIS